MRLIKQMDAQKEVAAVKNCVGKTWAWMWVIGSLFIPLEARGESSATQWSVLGDVLTQQIGVSLAGGEFGVEHESFSNWNPGTHGKDYLLPSKSAIRQLRTHGVRLFRVPIRWERMQPHLGAPLNKAELGELKRVLSDIGSCGGRAIIDLHNYARYRLNTADGARTVVIDEEIDGEVLVSREHLADFWRRLTVELDTHPSVAALAIMNEPHDLGNSNWKVISQAAVDAIRSQDMRTWVIVAGEDWSSAERFQESNGAQAWINDPAGRVAYEAHCYFDADGSGQYKRSYAHELRIDPQIASRPLNRVQPFVQWCRANQVPGFLGEFGVPVGDPDWEALLEAFVAELKHEGLPACAWAAGEWWGDYPLSLHPTAGNEPVERVLSLITRD